MSRKGYTLLELLLALGLSVLATALIGGLMQLYANNFNTRGEDIRRVALARSLLNMIADDLRSTVTKQELDTSVLQQMLVGSGGGSMAGTLGGAAGGGGAGGGAGGGSGGGTGEGQGGGGQGGNTGGGTGGSNSNPSSGSAGTSGGSSQGSRGGSSGSGTSSGQSSGGSAGGMSGRGQSGGAPGGQSSSGTSGQAGGQSGETDAAGTGQLSASTPLGIYGSQYQLTFDISRLPRPDEYMAQMNNPMTGTLGDVPGDIKNVTYFVQMPSATGVADSLSQVSSTATTPDSSIPGGLVRRQIDRNVMAYAEEQGQMMQLQQTGDLIAPEVIALDFMYFDGTQWTTSWDSSSQSLPWLVEISLAMQSATGEKRGVVPPGTSISTMPIEEQKRLGVQVYRLVVAIPGAQLQAAPAQATDQAAGMQAMGLK